MKTLLCLTLIFLAPIQAEQNGKVAAPLRETVEGSVKWTLPQSDTVKAQLDDWLRTVEPPPPAIFSQIEALWTHPLPVSSGQLNARLLESMRLASRPAREYLDACAALEWNGVPFAQPVVLPDVPPEIKPSAFLCGALRLHLAQSLVRMHLFDEARDPLEELTPGNCCDPAAALLLKGIVYSKLMQREKGDEALRRFREIAGSDSLLPRRYSEIAKLIEADLKKQKQENEDDLRSVARRMEDVKRRLGTGRTGEKVQEAEQDVLKSLDKIIEKVEKQMKECDGDQGQQANNPAKDSKILRQKGPGNVHDKDIGDSAGWGNLPPKEREEALLRMEKEFPSHYRAIIESYFRETAQTD